MSDLYYGQAVAFHYGIMIGFGVISEIRVSTNRHGTQTRYGVVYQDEDGDLQSVEKNGEDLVHLPECYHKTWETDWDRFLRDDVGRQWALGEARRLLPAIEPLPSIPIAADPLPAPAAAPLKPGEEIPF